MNFLEMLLSAVMIVLFLLPVFLVLGLATFAAKLFLVLFEPITNPIHRILLKIAEAVPDPLERIPMFPSLKRCFGSSKNILFICFVILFLIVYYLSLGNVDNIFDNISLLFPGTALEQVTSYGSYNGKLDISSFFVNPESYLRTIIFSFIAGVFMHIGCTTKDPDAKIHILVKLLYSLLITLFSSVVLGMLPADLFKISIPEISLDFSSIGAVTGGSDIQKILAGILEWGGVLLEKLVGIIPTFVALYFLSRTICGFAAAFLGGFIAICGVAIGCPNGLADPNSFQAVSLLLFMLAVGEVVTLMLSETINILAEGWVSENKGLLGCYNIVSLLISYFFYPALGLAVLLVIFMITGGFDVVVFLVCLACLLVFALSIFAGYKITRWTLWDHDSIDGTTYAVAMVFNIPIWILYIVLFAV